MATKNDKWEGLIFLSLGSNLGSCLKNLELARKFIVERVGEIELCSSIYKTAPWGEQDLNFFYNQVIGVASKLSSTVILEICQEIEQQLGRLAKQTNAYEDRVIDIDLLIHGCQIITTTRLNLPHPLMQLRNFVLVPFAEIAPNVLHPELNQRIITLKNNSTDYNKIERIE